VALLWQMICNLGGPMSLRHPVHELWYTSLVCKSWTKIDCTHINLNKRSWVNPKIYQKPVELSLYSGTAPIKKAREMSYTSLVWKSCKGEKKLGRATDHLGPQWILRMTVSSHELWEWHSLFSRTLRMADHSDPQWSLNGWHAHSTLTNSENDSLFSRTLRMTFSLLKIIQILNDLWMGGMHILLSRNLRMTDSSHELWEWHSLFSRTLRMADHSSPQWSLNGWHARVCATAFFHTAYSRGVEKIICLYVRCIYVCVYVHICICLHVYVHMRVYVCVCVCVFMWVCANVRIHTHVHMRIHVYLYTYTYIHIYVYTHIYTDMYIYMYI